MTEADCLFPLCTRTMVCARVRLAWRQILASMDRKSEKRLSLAEYISGTSSLIDKADSYLEHVYPIYIYRFEQSLLCDDHTLTVGILRGRLTPRALRDFVLSEYDAGKSLSPCFNWLKIGGGAKSDQSAPHRLGKILEYDVEGATCQLKTTRLQGFFNDRWADLSTNLKLSQDTKMFGLAQQSSW
ncbi:hypothetical protein RvY_15470 [Ramazzottius varieornatus]|uniref:Uncharacterized protein n=1 Tax=Ramazzottius varieornatus TaxID=947166 RepID=A0A1D1VV16_RAMVA|nr:hypothetical protein RvY_15470 [Ramazzottius varieornatus]